MLRRLTRSRCSPLKRFFCRSYTKKSPVLYFPVETIKLGELPDEEQRARWIERPIANRLVIDEAAIGLLETEEGKEVIAYRAPVGGMLLSVNESDVISVGDIVGTVDTDQSDDTLLTKHLASNNNELSDEFVKELVNRDNNYDRIQAIAILLRERFPDKNATALKILERVRERHDDPLKKAFLDTDIGILYDKMGDLDSALTHLQRAVDVRKQHSMQESLGLRPTKKEKYSESDERRAELREEKKNMETAKLIDAIFSLAGVKHSRGDIKEAKEDLEQCLQLQMKFLRQDDEDIAHTHYNLAAIAWRQGFAQDAIDHYGKALLTYEEKWPDGHEDTANTRHMMAIISQHLGDWANAKEHAEKAVTVRQVVLGERHADTALAHVTLAQILTEIGEDCTERALQEFNKAYEIQVEHYGKEHVVPAETLGKAGTVYYQIGRHEEALEKFHAAVDVSEKLGDKGTTASLLNSIGLVHYQRSEFDTAEVFHQKAYNLIVQLRDQQKKDAPTTKQLMATTLGSIGNIHKQQHRFHEALYEYQRAHDMLFDTLGPSHPDVASSWNNMGQLHALQGNFDVALEQYGLALETFRTVLGGDDGTNHPHIAACHFNIGLVNHEKGDATKAKENLEKARDIWATTLGKEHPQTIAAEEVIGMVSSS